MPVEVRFKTTAFNVTTPKPYFINECCYGDDLCRWMIAQLRSRGISTDDEPGQEDFGWYFDFQIGKARSCFIVGFQPNDAAAGDQWLGWIERVRGPLGTLLGGRLRNIDPEAIAAVDSVLRQAPEIDSIEWVR